MFNPFVKFEEKFITAFRKVKKRYLVTQKFKRYEEQENENKTFLMLTHYEDKGWLKYISMPYLLINLPLLLIWKMMCIVKN